MEGVEWEMEGEALRVRRLSRRILFFDLLLSRPPLFLSPCSPLLSSVAKGSLAVSSRVGERCAVPALVEGGRKGTGGAVTVEVVLKGPTGREDVRAQGREVKQGALLRVRGNAIEWRLKEPTEGQAEERTGAGDQKEDKKVPVPVPGCPSPAAALGCDIVAIAIASDITRLVPLHSARSDQQLTPSPAVGSQEPEVSPAGGARVLVPRQRPQEWNTLVHLPQSRQPEIATAELDASLLKPGTEEGAPGAQQNEPGGSPGCAREQGHEWELMAPPGTGYAMEPTCAPGDTGHSDAGYSEIVHSFIGCIAHSGSRGQEGACGVVEDGGGLQGVCRVWLNTGQCQASEAGVCAHRHPPPGELSALRQEWISARLARRAELRSVDPFDPVKEDLKQGRQGRARVFAAWLVELMGAERLSAGRGVLDIAGGRGPLSFALAAIHGVPCTLLDPRPRKLSRSEAKLLKREAKHLKRQQARERTKDKAEGDITAGLAAGMPLVHQTDHSDGASTDQMKCIQGEFYACEPRWQEQARAHSCLVGLHPDQATGEIVFAAVANRQPFAVVPCCVFPGRFARRRLRRTGQHVQSAEELCQYLMEMCRAGGGLPQREWLPFKGRNAVVYCTHYESQ